MQQTKEIKIVLLGDSGVGKSSLLMRFIDNEFSEKGQPTLGAAFQSKTMVIDERPLKFQIWDTAGQEKYKAILPLYYRDAKVALLVYDINEKQSFQGIKEWTKQLQESGPIDQIRAIIANKSDLECQINSNIAQEFAIATNALFFTTSCKDNIGIQVYQYFEQETFYKIGQKIFEESGNEDNKKSQAENQSSTLKISSQQNENKQKQQSSFCC